MSIEILTSTILSKMSSIGKWQAKFFIDLTHLWLGLKGRYHFENLSRQGDMSSESYRANFSKSFDFKAFNLELFKYLGVEKVWVFDGNGQPSNFFEQIRPKDAWYRLLLVRVQTKSK